MRRGIPGGFSGGAEPTMDVGQSDDPLAAAYHALEFELQVLPLLADALEESSDRLATDELASVGKVLRRDACSSPGKRQAAHADERVTRSE
jgi:hypothetical protein